MERVKQGLPPPSPPVISASAPPGEEGCLRVTWKPDALSPGVVRLFLYCTSDGDGGEVRSPQDAPRVAVDAAEGSAVVRSLRNGTMYRVAARAVNGDGAASGMGPVVTARPADRRPPRPGRLRAFVLPGGRNVRIGWRPHVLDDDMVRVHILARDKEGRERELRTVDAAPLLSAARPFYCTAPFLQITVRDAADFAEFGVWCEDRAGNRGETHWERPVPPPASREAPCELRILAPTAQVRADGPFPENAAVPSGLRPLRLLQGQAKGFQVLVRAERPLHDARIEFDPLRAVNGRASIPAKWLAWHVVKYVHLEKNSRATPASELVWKAPADYPDELDDADLVDVPRGTNQPFYVRVTAPRGVPPGEYRGEARLVCREGRKPVEIRIRVEPLLLPERPRLKFVYWFSWKDACKQFGVEQFSEDGWRVLRRLGELMHAHHQNVVRVPWQLIRTWRQADGRLVHDFRDFDRFIRTFREAGVDAMFCLQHVGGRATGQWTCPTMVSRRHRVVNLPDGSESDMDVLDLLPAVQAHIGELGLLDRFAVHVADEPIPENLESYRELSARVHARAPKLRRIDAVHVPDLEGALEIWVPQLNYFEKWLDRYRAAQRKGYEIWFYVAWVPQGRYPNRMIDSHAIKPRVLHWLNALYGTSGYLHWALNHWHISLMSLQSPGDQYICWPSRRFIADSSLRYEAEREGLEDCELIWMLRDALERSGMSRDEAMARIRRLITPAVVDFRNYTRDWDVMESARARMLDALEKIRK